MELFASEIACPNCGKQVKASSKFCVNCGGAIAAASAQGQSASPPKLQENHWARQPDDFAVRIGGADVRGLKGGLFNLTRPLVIEHGTRALIFSAGAFRGEAPAGRYDMNGDLSGLARALNFLKTDQHVVAVLVDAGDVTLDVALTEDQSPLVSRDGFSIGTNVRIVLQIAEPERMFVNLMKGRERVLVRGQDGASGYSLESELVDEIRMVLTAMVAARSVEELITPATLQLRSEIESVLQRALGATLDRLGLALVQVRFIGFSSDGYGKVRTTRGEKSQEGMIGQVNRDAAVAKRQGEIAAKEVDQKFDRREAELNVDEYKWRNELDKLTEVIDRDKGIRDDDKQRLKERLKFEREQITDQYSHDKAKQKTLRELEIARIKNDDQREEAWRKLDGEERQNDEQHRRHLQRTLEATKSGLERKPIEIELLRLDHAEKLRQDAADHDEEMRKVRLGLENVKQIKAMEAEEDRLAQELEEQKLKARSTASGAALISIIGGDDAGANIMELEKHRMRSGMTPEQILAMAAADQPEAAKALAEKFKQEGNSREVQLLRERLVADASLSEAHRGELKEILKTAMEQMGNVATAKATPSGSSTVSCKFCGRAIGAATKFCSFCGKPQPVQVS